MSEPTTEKDRIRKTAEAVVVYVSVAVAQQTSTALIEAAIDYQIRGLVEDLSTILARDSAIRWEQRADDMQEQLLRLTTELAEARRLIIEARESGPWGHSADPCSLVK